MKGPCYGCVAPVRHPGCHDSCTAYKEYSTTESTLKTAYKEKYLCSRDTFNVVTYDRILRHRKKNGMKTNSKHCNT